MVYCVEVFQLQKLLDTTFLHSAVQLWLLNKPFDTCFTNHKNY